MHQVGIVILYTGTYAIYEHSLLKRCAKHFLLPASFGRQGTYAVSPVYSTSSCRCIASRYNVVALDLVMIYIAP